jgi:hypothetical protein
MVDDLHDEERNGTHTPVPTGDTALGNSSPETTPQPTSDPPVPPHATPVAGLGVEGQQPEQAPGREEVTADAADIEQALRLLLLPGFTYELRVPKYPTPQGPRNRSWYFRTPDRLADMADQAARASATDGVRAVYVGLNPLPVPPEGQHYEGSGNDGDIAKRALLLVDCDPKRPKGTNAADAEKRLAHDKALQVRDHLREQGWPEPVLADSGNGYHLLYRIELPNDAASTALVRNALRTLAARFDSDAVKVDTTVYNASRVTKLYGTVARKGEDTPDRPWRKSAIREAPDALVPVPRELLEELAAEVQQVDQGGPVEGVEADPETDAPRPVVLQGIHLATALRRGERYVAQMPDSIEGQNGHTALYNAAQALVRGFLLTPEQAYPVLVDFNNHKADPPWDEEELHRKLEQAETKSRLPWGYLLNAEEDDGLPSQAAGPAPAGEQPASNPEDVEGMPEGGQDGGGPLWERKSATTKFPPPVAISHLATTAARQVEWLWEGYVPRRAIVLLTALWKSGKTTLLTHLLKAMGDGQEEFCGLALRPCKVLMVTQEGDGIWTQRRQQHGLKDEVLHFQRGPDDYPQPFRGKPSQKEWDALARHLERVVLEDGFGLVVIDPLADFWPVKDENNASEQTTALLPLRRVTHAGASVLLLHHPRKSDGTEGTAARGSGQLPAFVDVILELRRANPANLKDTCRVITALSRYDETPREWVIELTGGGYVARGGTKAEAVTNARRGREDASIASLLPTHPPGLTVNELLASWPGGQGKNSETARRRLSQILQEGYRLEKWHREGTGKKNDPYRFWRDAKGLHLTA